MSDEEKEVNSAEEEEEEEASETLSVVSETDSDDVGEPFQDDDGLWRCPNCSWEIVDGLCQGYRDTCNKRYHMVRSSRIESEQH